MLNYCIGACIFFEFDCHTLRRLFLHNRRLLVITGAGVSTASGIPDYRGPKGSYRLGHKPMSHQEFTSEARHRQRYWARSMVGFKKFDDVAPNRAHAALALLEQHGKLEALITQNVDGLHQRAGHARVIDLHGRVDVVKCLNCGARDLPRAKVQEELEAKNAAWMAEHLLRQGRTSQQQEDKGTQQRADGDAELGPDAHYASFQVPLCPSCGSGLLKPDVVFFGDNVPKTTVNQCAAHVDAADAVLVVGSSLEVYSAYRLVARCLKVRTLPTAPSDAPTAAPPGATTAPSSTQTLPPLKGAIPLPPARGLSAVKPPGSLQPTKPLCIINLGETRAERSGAAPLLKVTGPLKG